MPEQQVVIKVDEDFTGSGMPLWRVRLRREDGSEREHIFPQMTFEARAAEYGLDPEDIDTLMEVVLHEPFIPHPEDPKNIKADPAAKKGYVTPCMERRGALNVGDEVPVWLYNAETINAAREAHMIRIKHCQENTVKIETSGGAGLKIDEDPLQKIRKNYKPDKERVNEMRKIVEEHKQQIRHQMRLSMGEK